MCWSIICSASQSARLTFCFSSSPGKAFDLRQIGQATHFRVVPCFSTNCRYIFRTQPLQALWSQDFLMMGFPHRGRIQQLGSTHTQWTSCWFIENEGIAGSIGCWLLCWCDVSLLVGDHPLICRLSWRGSWCATNSFFKFYWTTFFKNFSTSLKPPTTWN